MESVLSNASVRNLPMIPATFMMIDNATKGRDRDDSF
jgi:hypothetical protein